MTTIPESPSPRREQREVARPRNRTDRWESLSRTHATPERDNPSEKSTAPRARNGRRCKPRFPVDSFPATLPAESPSPVADTDSSRAPPRPDFNSQLRAACVRLNPGRSRDRHHPVRQHGPPASPSEPPTDVATGFDRLPARASLRLTPYLTTSPGPRTRPCARARLRRSPCASPRGRRRGRARSHSPPGKVASRACSRARRWRDRARRADRR